MARARRSEQLLVQEIRQGDSQAWNKLIAAYEGRLLAFVESRLRNRSTAEDVVQDAFVGFLVSLPNYDGRRSLESYLFSIASHKLADYLRREGRRPTVPLSSRRSESEHVEVVGHARGASTILRSRERRNLEEEVLAATLAEQIDYWKGRGDWEKVQAVELLFVRGWANKDVAEYLGVSEQAVANWKFDFLAKLRSAIRRRNLSEDVFPELRSNGA